jgi:hypothetical protein
VSQSSEAFGLVLVCALSACSGDPTAQHASPELRSPSTMAGAAGAGAPSNAPIDFGQPASPSGTPAATPSGAPVAGGGGAASSTLAPNAGSSALDAAPNEMTGVTFDWPETEPSSGGAGCKPGRYVGEYACRLYIIDTSGEGAFDVSGTIDMQLEQTPDGELLRIADGHFASATLAAIPMTADIVGELDCSSARFEGRLENGLFSVALGLPIPFTVGTFSGPLSSDYDRDAAALDGAWDMMGELDGFPGTCMGGSWSARWVP